MATTRRPEDERKLRKIATDFWFAVQRMGRRGDEPPPAAPEPPPDVDPGRDDLDSSGVPRRPAPSAGPTSATVSEPDETDSP